MYKEEYADRGFPFRDFLLKLILIAVCVFLVLWFVPKFISMNKNKCDDKCTSEKVNKSLSANLKKMQRAGLTYFTEDRVPKNEGESVDLTLKDMINKNIITIKNAKRFDLTKSYLKISKLNDEYLMRIKLKSGKYKKKTILHLNNYSYCDIYLCEKDNSKEEKDEVTVEDNVENTTVYNNYKQETKTVVKKYKTIKKTKHYQYKYVKYKKAIFTKWNNWSSWTVTNCSAKKVSCSDDDINCLRKVQRYDKKEQIGTKIKKYTYDRNIIKYYGSINKSVCTNGNYVIINGKLYKASTNYTFSLVEKNKLFSNIPMDSLYYHYQFVSRNHYNVYKYNGILTEANSNCEKPIVLRVPLYRTTSIKDVEVVKEPIYKTTCYESVKTRKLISKGKVLYKWSKFNDSSLIKKGWILTKTKKRV